VVLWECDWKEGFVCACVIAAMVSLVQGHLFGVMYGGKCVYVNICVFVCVCLSGKEGVCVIAVVVSCVEGLRLEQRLVVVKLTKFV
jgi:hypothetical protein